MNTAINFTLLINGKQQKCKNTYKKTHIKLVVFKFLVQYRYSAFMLKLLVTCQNEHELLFPKRIIAQVTEQVEAMRTPLVDIKYFDFRIR